MYISGTTAGGSNAEPEGSAGPNDHWHYHTGICLVAGPNGTREALASTAASRKRIAVLARARGWRRRSTCCTDGAGVRIRWVFAHVNPALMCGDGTYYTDAHDITNARKTP